MRLNPLTYGMAALRESLYAGNRGAMGSLPSMALSLTIAIVFAIATFALAARTARRSAAY